MSNMQLEKIKNNTVSDNLIKNKFNTLSKEQQDQLTQLAVEKRISFESQIMQSNIDAQNADIDCQRHMETLSRAQREHYSKGATKINSDIKTSSGNMHIESKTGGVGCLLPIIFGLCILLLLL